MNSLLIVLFLQITAELITGPSPGRRPLASPPPLAIPRPPTPMQSLGQSPANPGPPPGQPQATPSYPLAIPWPSQGQPMPHLGHQWANNGPPTAHLGAIQGSTPGQLQASPKPAPGQPWASLGSALGQPQAPHWQPICQPLPQQTLGKPMVTSRPTRANSMPSLCHFWAIPRPTPCLEPKSDPKRGTRIQI